VADTLTRTLTKRRRLEDCRRLTDAESRLLTNAAKRIRKLVAGSDAKRITVEEAGVPANLLRSPFLDFRLRLPADDQPPIFQRAATAKSAGCFCLDTRDPAKQLPKAPSAQAHKS
jgi:hypothetical protein